MKFCGKIIALLKFIHTKIFIKNIQFGNIVFIGKGALLRANRGKINFIGRSHLSDFTEIRTSNGFITIGNKVSLNKYSRIVSRNSITLGNNIKIAQFVTIIDHDHNIELKESKLDIFNGYTTAPIVIGDNVWIADKVTILKGVNIGSNVVIAANSVVTTDIPSNSICGGIPCKLIKKLS